MSLTLDVRVGDMVEIDNGRVTIKVEDKSGQRTRLAFNAPKEVKIRMVERPGSAGAFARKGLKPFV
jgi:sRNA-binding carbon storage regulator CsrA